MFVNCYEREKRIQKARGFETERRVSKKIRWD
jgi:hypothetical protein